jgi:hypothetical protein
MNTIHHEGHEENEEKTFFTTNDTNFHERKLKPNAVDFIFLRKNHTPQ